MIFFYIILHSIELHKSIFTYFSLFYIEYHFYRQKKLPQSLLRQQHIEDQLALYVVHVDSAAMSPYDGLSGGQADAEPAGIPWPRGIRPVKSVEEMKHLSVIHVTAGIGHRQKDEPAFFRQR